MTVQKCDACGKTIKGKMVLAGYSEHFLGHKVFCEKCGTPVIKFLRQINMLEGDKEKALERKSKTKVRK